MSNRESAFYEALESVVVEVVALPTWAVVVDAEEDSWDVENSWGLGIEMGYATWSGSKSSGQCVVVGAVELDAAVDIGDRERKKRAEDLIDGLESASDVADGNMKEGSSTTDFADVLTDFAGQSRDDRMETSGMSQRPDLWLVRLVAIEESRPEVHGVYSNIPRAFLCEFRAAG